MAETLTKLAPGGQEARGLGVADDRRPNGALSLARLLVFVADMNLSPAADPQPGPRNVEPINGQHSAYRHADAWLCDEGLQTFGHNRGDLGDEIARSARKHSVALFAGDVARAADNHTVIIEFRVGDVDAEFRRLSDVIDGSLVQAPTTMPWGNRSLLFRDPDGNLVNFFAPISAEAIKKFAQ